MRFSSDREAEFAEIERRADAVKKLRAIPNADDVVSISLVAGRVYVVVNEITNPGHCTSCGTPRGDRVEVDIDDRDVREALARIFDDRARSLHAIATGKYEAVEPAHPMCRSSIEPIEPPRRVTRGERPFPPVRYGRENVPDPREGQIVTFAIGGPAWVPLNEWTIYNVAGPDVFFRRDGEESWATTIELYKRWVDSVRLDDRLLLWELDDVPF